MKKNLVDFFTRWSARNSGSVSRKVSSERVQLVSDSRGEMGAAAFFMELLFFPSSLVDDGPIQEEVDWALELNHRYYSSHL